MIQYYISRSLVTDAMDRYITVALHTVRTYAAAVSSPSSSSIFEQNRVKSSAFVFLTILLGGDVLHIYEYQSKSKKKCCKLARKICIYIHQLGYIL